MLAYTRLCQILALHQAIKTNAKIVKKGINCRKTPNNQPCSYICQIYNCVVSFVTKITEYPELEGSHKDHEVHVINLNCVFSHFCEC